METIFENSYVSNVEMLTELNRNLSGVKNLIYGCIMLACAVITTRCVLLVFRWWWLLLAVLEFGYGLYLLFGNRFWAIRVVRSIEKKHNGQIPPAMITVTKDHFCHQYLSDSITFPVENLKKALFLKHSIFVQNENGMYMTFQRTGFTKGTPEELEAFIRGNCPKAEIIYKV